jgi:hypothetical protein
MFVNDFNFFVVKKCNFLLNRVKLSHLLPPSDEGGGFMRSKKTEGEMYKKLPQSLPALCKGRWLDKV